jgi:hypothetical protein
MKINITIDSSGEDKRSRKQSFFSPEIPDIPMGKSPMNITFFDGATTPMWKKCEKGGDNYTFTCDGDERDYLYVTRTIVLKYRTETEWDDFRAYSQNNVVKYDDKYWICRLAYDGSIIEDEDSKKPGGTNNYWANAELSTQVRTVVYSSSTEKTTCTIDDSFALVELFSFKKWADIPEWSAAVNKLGESDLELKDGPFTTTNINRYYRHYTNTFEVPQSTIESEYDIEKEESLRWDRKPIINVDTQDSSKRWSMKDGQYNFRIRLVSDYLEDPDVDINPDLDFEGDSTGSVEIEEDENTGGLKYSIKSIGDYGIKFNEVGTNSRSVYFGVKNRNISKDISYAMDWLDPDGMFFAPFDTTDEINFKITETYDYSDDAVDGKIIPNYGSIQIFLMPRRWAYYCASVIETHNLTGGISFTEVDFINGGTMLIYYDENLTALPYHLSTSLPPSWGGELMSRISVGSSNPSPWFTGTASLTEIHEHIALWWDRFPNKLSIGAPSISNADICQDAFFEDQMAKEHSGTNYIVPWRYIGDYQIVIGENNFEYPDAYYFIAGQAYEPGVCKTNHSHPRWWEDDSENFDIIPEKQATTVNVIGDDSYESIKTRATNSNASQEYIDNILSGSNCFFICCKDENIYPHTQPDFWPMSSLAIGYERLFSQDDFKFDESFNILSLYYFGYYNVMLDNKFKSSDFFTRFLFGDESVDFNHLYSLSIAQNPIVSVSPHKAGSLIAIIRIDEILEYYVWRKTDEEFMTNVYNPTNYDDFKTVLHSPINGYASFNQGESTSGRKIDKFGVVSEGTIEEKYPSGVFITYVTPGEPKYNLEMPIYPMIAPNIIQQSDSKVYSYSTTGLVGAIPWIFSFPRPFLVIESSYPEWLDSYNYQAGDFRMHKGFLYECIETHNSENKKPPGIDLELWKLKVGHITGISQDCYQTDLSDTTNITAVRTWPSYKDIL